MFYDFRNRLPFILSFVHVSQTLHQLVCEFLSNGDEAVLDVVALEVKHLEHNQIIE